MKNNLKNHFKKYPVCYILLLPVLCLWMRWYQHMIPDPKNAELLSANGFYVFARNTGRFGIVFFLVFSIQFLVCCLQKYYTASIIPLLLLLFEVFQVPGIEAYYYSGLWPVTKALFREGAILTCICTILCIIIRILEVCGQLRKSHKRLPQGSTPVPER